MKLSELFDVSQLHDEIQQGYVRLGLHPNIPLRVLCYTDKAVFERRWNSVTRRCRGLIVGPDDEIMAHCMPKFFNASEHIGGAAHTEPLPNEPFQLFSKVDGSMGTVFNHEGRWMVATKGGFGSKQAQWAQAWLDKRDLSALPSDCTFVTEIVYPENRIVVDYGDMSSMCLLVVFGPDGTELSMLDFWKRWDSLGGTTIMPHRTVNLSRVLFFAQRNKNLFGDLIRGTQAEGYVLRYESGLRVKVKFTDYVRLHGIVTGLTERHVWEILRDGRTLDSLYEVLPDEYHDWLAATASLLAREFQTYARGVVDALHRSPLPSDPRIFMAFDETQIEPFSGLLPLYLMVSRLSWDAIKPAATGPWTDHE